MLRATYKPLFRQFLKSTPRLNFPSYNIRMVQTITSAAEFKSAIAKGNAIVDFYATWCGPCKMISPVLEKLDPQYENINFFKLDIEAVQDIAAEYQVSSVPFFLFTKDGDTVDTVRGAAPALLKKSLDNLAAL